MGEISMAVFYLVCSMAQVSAHVVRVIGVNPHSLLNTD